MRIYCDAKIVNFAGKRKEKQKKAGPPFVMAVPLIKIQVK